MVARCAKEAGILDPDQAELVQNVFRLTKKSVADCMVPREKMAALELTAPLEQWALSVPDRARAIGKPAADVCLLGDQRAAAWADRRREELC